MPEPADLFDAFLFVLKKSPLKTTILSYPEQGDIMIIRFSPCENNLKTLVINLVQKNTANN